MNPNLYSVQDKALLASIRDDAGKAVRALCDLARLQPEDLFIVGCSSSEILGEKIGNHSSVEVAGAVFDGIYPVLKDRGLWMAVQCCEHLNRAVILESAAARQYGYAPVNVQPIPKAGGSLAATAFERFEHPVAVESIAAAAGIDIGLTMIGMHLRPVAVPVRLDIRSIGKAPIVCARTRPKFIGGARAVYNQELL